MEKPLTPPVPPINDQVSPTHPSPYPGSSSSPLLLPHPLNQHPHTSSEIDHIRSTQEEEDEETETLISSDLDSSSDLPHHPPSIISRSNSPSIHSQRSVSSQPNQSHQGSSPQLQHPSPKSLNNPQQQHSPASSSKPSSILPSSNPSLAQIEQLPSPDSSFQPTQSNSRLTVDHPLGKIDVSNDPPSQEHPTPLDPPQSLPSSPRIITTPKTSNHLTRSLDQPTLDNPPQPISSKPTTPTPPSPSLSNRHQDTHPSHPSNDQTSQTHSNSPTQPSDNQQAQRTLPILPLTISPPIRSANNTPRHSSSPTSNGKSPPPPPHPSSQLVSPASTLPPTDTTNPRRPSGSSHLSPTSLQFMQNMPGRSRRQLGEYTLGKTLGAGSMGKVKLAISSITGEKIAIKIIPRHTSLSAAQQQLEKDKNKENQSGPSTGRDKDQKHLPTPSPSFIEKAKNKDISKEIRTIREASIVLLLHHPYVCGMKSMLVYPVCQNTSCSLPD